jgi:hypothetical protein
MTKSNIYYGKYENESVYLIDTEGGVDTDQIYDKIPEETIKHKYLFKWFYNLLRLEKTEIMILVQEINEYLSNQENLQIFDRPKEIKDYLRKIQNILQTPLDNNWIVQIEAN